MSDKENFEFESYQDAETIVKYLESLIDGLQKGELTLTSGKNQIVLKPSNLMEVSIKARVKGEKNKLTIKIAWKEDKLQEDLVGKSLAIE